MTVTPEHAAELCQRAEQYYNPNQPYHNWNHALEVMSESDRLCQRLGERGRQVNRSLMLVSAAWHDAGHDHDEANNFASKEHYSVYLAQHDLAGDISADEMATLENGILGTRFGVERQTDEALILHYADVANMAYLYPEFLDHSAKLWREYGGDWDTFVKGSKRVIEQTIRESLTELSPRIATHSDPYYFAEQARINLTRLEGQTPPR